MCKNLSSLKRCFQEKRSRTYFSEVRTAEKLSDINLMHVSRSLDVSTKTGSAQRTVGIVVSSLSQHSTVSSTFSEVCK